ncbi:MAG: hypothetical protein DRJ05_18960, partial [Bacteroidetes bacterium]
MMALPRIIILKGLIFSLIIIFLSSCETKNEDEVIIPPSNSGYTDGTLILNQGTFPTETGTVDFMEKNGSVHHGIFHAANNGEEAGNVVQSAFTMNNYTFLVVNNADKIIVVDKFDFTKIKEITELPSPRYFLGAGSTKAYVSCWDNTIKIIDIDNLQVTGSIPTGTGPERMKFINNKLWVLNQGGLSIDSTITIINPVADTVLATLEVYPKPSGIVVDYNMNVWIMCSGHGWNNNPGNSDSKGHLLCVDPFDYSIITDIEFPDNSKHPEQLIVNNVGDKLFYNYPGGISLISVDDPVVFDSPFIPHNNMFNGLLFSKSENFIYASDALDYQQNGIVYRFNGITGELIDSGSAGLIPGEFYFVDF